MSAREHEAELLNACADAALAVRVSANSQEEANVFRVAAMVIQSRVPYASRNLMAVSERYFVAHPDELLPPVEVVQRGWVANLPRLRDMLYHELGGRMHEVNNA